MQKRRDREDLFIVGYSNFILGLGRDRDNLFIVEYRIYNDIRILFLVLGRDSIYRFRIFWDILPGWIVGVPPGI